ncbi:C-type lectin 37Db-like [Haliotis cracherodii]|uniref:C-type lectin 37Db-like n=1 Tax=Haliotis cracherodii TaxID=6455 RepID=UPI0039E94859
MATVKMMLDLVLVHTLPTSYMAVVKVDSVLDCAHECMRQSTCEAMAFSTLYLVCYLYQGSIQADPSASADMELWIYNFKRGAECSGAIGSIPGPAYPACPIGSGYSYEPALNVCYKRLYSSNRAGKATCIQEGGSDLLKIDTQEKQDFFGALVPRTEYTYIQGDRIPSTGEWAYWEEGTARPMPFIDWAPGQPNGDTHGQDCITLDIQGQNDAPCSYWYYFFCEYDM